MVVLLVWMMASSSVHSMADSLVASMGGMTAMMLVDQKAEWKAVMRVYLMADQMVVTLV